MTPRELRPIYETSLALRCLCRAGEARLPDVAGSIAKLAESQNEDGGWDANIWGAELPSKTRVWSEVGGTSMALQALVEDPKPDLAVIEKGARRTDVRPTDAGLGIVRRGVL